VIVAAGDRDSTAASGALPAGEAIAAASGAVLVIALVVLKWYGLAGTAGPFAPRPSAGGSVSGWNELTTLRWLAVATAVCSWSVLAAAVGRGLAPRVARGAGIAIAGLGGATALLLGYRVLVALPGHRALVDQKLGAVLGVLAALGVALGGRLVAAGAEAPVAA
jgi:hypothetical protein